MANRICDCKGIAQGHSEPGFNSRLLFPDLVLLYTKPVFLVKDVWTDPPKRRRRTGLQRAQRTCQERPADPTRVLPQTSPDRAHCLSMRKIQNDRSEPRPPVIENAQKEGEEAVVVKADGDAERVLCRSRRPEAGKDVQSVGHEGARFRGAAGGHPGNAGTRRAGLVKV